MGLTQIVVCACGAPPVRARGLRFDLGCIQRRDWAPCSRCYKKLYEMKEEGVLVVEAVTKADWGRSRQTLLEASPSRLLAPRGRSCQAQGRRARRCHAPRRATFRASHHLPPNMLAIELCTKNYKWKKFTHAVRWASYLSIEARWLRKVRRHERT
ncbi:hypothetical protein D3C71_1638380 [compost metagenome]